MKDAAQEAPARYDASALASLVDMGAPQASYRAMVDQEVVQLTPGMVVVASRQAVNLALKNWEVFTSEGVLTLGNIRPLIPLSVDPPRHVKYRKILDPLFTPRRMDAIEGDITARFNRFLDSFIDRGHCNFTDDLAEQFPSAIFLGLMGLPWEELDTFLRLRDGILRPGGTHSTLDPAARAAIQTQTGAEIYEYFGHFLDERVREPQDDILTLFLGAEVDGDQLTREEILDICFLFLIAGLDTVSDSLTCFWRFLAEHPAHRRQIVDNPSIIPSAVEELLRWETPVTGVTRRATADTELVGFPIAAGTTTRISLGACNVDPTEYPDADVVRFDRESNRHLAFGGGVHRCLGSHLARRELRVALREWHARIPDYEIPPGTELVFPPGLRSVGNLQLSWPASPST
jgi:cytochrome P450